MPIRYLFQVATGSFITVVLIIRYVRMLMDKNGACHERCDSFGLL